ncbi:P-loop containing nucleoside triphosphate hydrolase protein [Xylariales sp. PMI_506]|nr:P-loop containing nucleoside triphosphate hydrolase protein [Xylariales sp. PMI_506]
MTAAEMLVGDHRHIFDIIDKLRAQGISRYVDLPEIIVCGDQSAGKSSVLEAISTMRFPTKEGLCTRFATELVLRRGDETSTKVFIIPGEDRYDKEKEDLERWQPHASIDNQGLETVTEEAMEAMSVPVPRRFYDDILRIELTGPTQPHLTMVDLPGLFRAGNKEQSDADGNTVRSMVEKYMARPRSIILAVVSAKNEYVLQEVTSMAKQADPEGLRTMGLITKPDTLDVGSDSEGWWVRLAQNAEVELRLGWHVLKNRKFEERGFTSAERDAVEEKFFSSGIWAGVNPSHYGVAALRIRLSSVLKDQILSQLPSLVQDVENGIRECTEELDRLGPVRQTQQQQQRYLMHMSDDYTSLTSQAINGAYMDGFFGSRKKHGGYPMRLRAVVQNRLLNFRDEMLLNGQSQRITNSDSEGEDEVKISESPCIPRSQYVQEVSYRLKFSRGRELPGLFNPLIVGDLFAEQCEPWRKIAKALTEDILDAAHQTTELVIRHIAARDVVTEMLEFIHEKIEELKVELDAKINELLASATQHPITYNRQLTENVQKAQQARHRRAIKQLIRKMLGSQYLDDVDRKINLNPVQLVDHLAQGLEPDMELFGSSTAVDFMEAYYKAAMNRFIDDVSVLAIEDCLIGKVSELFKPSTILEMSPEDISRLAGETEESSIERKRLVEKRDILDAGLRGLNGLQKPRQFARPAELNAGSSDDVENKPDMITPSSDQSSPANSIMVASAVMKLKGKEETVYEVDSEKLTTPPTVQWMTQGSEMPRHEEWEIPDLPRNVKSKKKIRSDPFEASVFQAYQEQ